MALIHSGGVASLSSLMGSKRKTVHDILCSMLLAAAGRGEASQTALYYATGLSFASAKKYIRMAVEAGLLREVRRGNRTRYAPTRKAYRYLRLNDQYS